MRNTTKTLIVCALAIVLCLGATPTLVNLASQVMGILAIANGGTGTASPGDVAGNGILLTGSWPTQTITATTATYLTNSLTSNVTMTTAGTFYTGPSVSLTAGTWYMSGSVTLGTASATTATEFNCKLWDGTTLVASTGPYIPVVSTAAVRYTTASLSGYITESGSATGEISCTASVASQIIEYETVEVVTANASTLTAIRIK